MNRAIRWIGAVAALAAAAGLAVPAINRLTTEIFFRNNVCGHALAVSIRGVRHHGGEVTAHTPPAIEAGCRSRAWNAAAPGLIYLACAVALTCIAAAWWALAKRRNLAEPERTEHQAGNAN